MKRSHSQWKHAQRTNSDTEALTYERQDTPHVRFGAPCVRVWFGIVSSLAIDMLLCSSFIDRFVHGIFPSDRKVVPLHSNSVAILVPPKHSNSSNPTTAVLNTPTGNDPKTNKEIAEMPTIIYMARQALCQPQTACHVMVTTSAFGIYSVTLKI